ncbi:MAG: N-acetylmuramoyl-L-alanine amidase [Cocleimonas sp.]|nr:N-acetylmuramoyl-L-alanine amidase [Cocleimonas sp.]
MKKSNKKRRDFIFKLAQALGLIGGGLLSPELLAKTGRRSSAQLLSVKDLGAKKSNTRQRLIFELDRKIKHSLFSLDSPERIVLDLKKTRLKTNLEKKLETKALVQGIRHATRHQHDLRVVFDLARASKMETKWRKTKKGYQLVITLTAKPGSKLQSKRKKVVKRSSTRGKNKKTTLVKKQTKRRDNRFVVAIDPGHGGKDPGAIGRKGTREKDVVLQIARRLKRRVNRQKGMTAFLTREGDYYVSLRKRMDKARAKGADLFISIHADANPNRRLTGSSVYILSKNGASSEAARWLANSENAYESKLGGAVVNKGNKVLSSLLMDLSQSATIDNSLGLAENVLKELAGINRLLRKKVESAAFVVLKSPDIPSMLVETAFISNPREERRLNSRHYQGKLANAMFHGIKRYHLAQKKNKARYA